MFCTFSILVTDRNCRKSLTYHLLNNRQQVSTFLGSTALAFSRPAGVARTSTSVAKQEQGKQHALKSYCTAKGHALLAEKIGPEKFHCYIMLFLGS